MAASQRDCGFDLVIRSGGGVNGCVVWLAYGVCNETVACVETFLRLSWCMEVQCDVNNTIFAYEIFATMNSK